MFKKVNEYNEKVHFKMYKKGKTWVYAGIAIVSLAVGVSQRQVTPVQAASVATTAATSSAATTQVNSSTAASTAGQAVATATTTNQASSATSAQSDAKPTVSQAGTTTAQVASSAASADKTTATTAANNVVTDQTTTATATTSTDYASSAAAASTASTDTAQVSNTRTTSDLPASATSASSAATSNGTVSSSTAAIATPAATTTSQTPVASSAADDVVYQSPQTKSLQDAGTTTTMPDGFSVSDPDHPDWVYAEPADSDWYTFAQMNTVSFEINRTDMTTVRVGMVAGTSGQLTINNFQTLPTASNDVQALKYGELTIFNNLDSIYVVGTLSSIYDVLQYPNGTKGSYSGYGFFKPVQQTQTTRYVDKNGNEIASAVEMTGLSGQKYETVPSADLVGYTPTDSGNTKGTMSPWTENGQTKSQIIYNTDFTKKGEIIYTVKDVNTGEITFTTPGSTTAPSGTDLIYGGDAGKAFGSYNVKNPYIPQTTNITYTYDAEKVPVTINYVDQNNQVIQAPTTTDIDYQATDAIDHPAIAGYTYDSSYTATATDNPADYTVTSLTNNTVTLHYQANPEQVTIQHVDENGTPIANVPDTVIATKFNATLALDGTTDSSYTISGYELDATASNPTTYQVVDGENTVVLHYVQQQPVTVNYVDQNGQLLDQNPATTLQGIVGETLPITSPTITGYTAYTDNPTQYTVTAGDNQVTLHYIQTKIPVSVALAAGTTDTLVFHDATGHVIERGGLVDSSATNGPKWPTTLAADGLTGAKTSTDANRNDMVRVVTENVYTYDQSGAEVPMSVELAYFTRTATVDFSDPAQPTVTYDGAWTAAQGAQTVTAALNTDYLPSLDYVLAHEIYNLPADEQAFAFDQKGNAIALATVALGGKSAQVVPAQQVTADTANFNVYVVYAKTTNLTKTYTRTVHFVDQSGTQISPDVVQTVTYTRTPILDTTNPTAPTVSQYTDWTTTNATFAQVDAAAVTGQFALTSAVPATQVAATETTLNTDATIVYVDATQTVQVNYVGTPAGYQPTQTSVTGTVNTTTTLTPDVIAGYQADATSYPVSFAIDAIGALVTPTITVTYTPKTVNGSVDLTATGLATPEEQALLENIPVTGQTGAVIQVAVPAVTGYTTTQTTTTVTVNPDGTITPNETIVYTPDQVTQDVTIETNQGPKTVVGVTGTVDNVIDVTVPEVPGYSSDKETVPATVNPDGTITVDKDTGTVTYTPTTHDYSITPVDKNGDPIPGTTATPKTGTTDTTIDSDTYPEVPGYTAETTEVNVPTGDTSVNVVYTPNDITATVTIPSNKGDQTVTGVTGTVGQTVEVDVPEVSGYTADKTTVPATVNPDGTITVDKATGMVTYTPTNHAYSITPVDKNGDPIPGTTTPATGTTDEVINREDYPEVPGYTAETTEVNVPTGDTSVNVVYTPNDITATVTIPSNKGDQTVTGVTGTVGQTVEVDVPEVSGYTADKTTVPATVNPDGTITVDKATGMVTYTPTNHAYSITPVDKNGDPIPGTTTPATGTTDEVINREDYPEVPGYTAETTEVNVPTGDTSVNVVYTPNDITATVTIPSNKGDQTVTGVTGTVGQTVEVDVPEVSGYTADKTTVPATVNPDGTITVDKDTGTVTYVPTIHNYSITPVDKNGTPIPGTTAAPETGTTDDVINREDYPEVPGYTAETTEVNVPTGDTSVNVVYTPNDITATVTIPSNKGDQTVTGVTGTVGTTVEVGVPEVSGYMADKTTVPATVNPDGTITVDKTTGTVTYTPTTHDYSITPVDKNGDSIPGTTAMPETGTTDTTIDSNTYPEVPGYTTETKVVTVPTGDTSVKVVYTPNTVTADVTIGTNQGAKIITAVTGTFGQGMTVNVPTVPGYTADQTEVPVTVNADGTITEVANTPDVIYIAMPQTIQIQYVGAPSTYTPTSTSLTGKTDETIDFTPDEIQGYTPDVSQYQVNFAVDAAGALKTPTLTVTYTGQSVKTTVAIPSNKGNQTVTDVTGTVGQTVEVDVPEVSGYTADKTKVPATVNPDGTITVDKDTETVNYTPTNHAYSITPVDKNGDPIPGTTATPEMGTTDTTIDNSTYPAVPGYTAETTAVTVPTGDTPVKVVYTPNTITATVTIPSNKGDQTVTDVTGTVGQTVEVDVPEVPGYTPDKTTVPATVNPDGTITVDKDNGTVTYTPTTHVYSITPVDENGDPIPGTTATPETGTTDTTIDSNTYPEVPGYTAETTAVTVPTGDTTVNVVYTPNTITATVTIPSNKGDQTVTGVTGTVGTTVEVDVPEVPGYTPDKTTVPATVNPDGTITVDKATGTINYTPTTHAYSITPVDKNGDPIPGTTATPETGTTDTTIDSNTYPEVPGYTAETTAVTVPTGDTTVNVVYTPNTITATVTIPSNKGDQTVTGVTGTVGTTVEVDVPEVSGYTPDKTTVPATVNPDGTITVGKDNGTVTYTPTTHAYSITPVDKNGDPIPGITATPETGTTDTTIASNTYPEVPGYTAETTAVTVPTGDTTVNVVYTPNDITATVTIPSNKGDQTVTGITGTVGTTVEVDVPEVSGYTPDKTTVPATVNPDGTITVDKATGTVTYTPQTQTATFTVPTTPQTATTGLVTDPEKQQLTIAVTGKTDELIEVPVPVITGYTADKTSLTVIIDGNGQATTTDQVTYTPNTVTLTVNDVDQNDGDKVVGTTTYTGTTDRPITDFVPQPVPGYTVVKTTMPATMPNTAGTVTVTLQHIIDQGTYQATRTISYAMQVGDTLTDGLALPDQVVQTADYLTAYDEVTQITTYTPLADQHFAAVASPTLTGYTADSDVAAATVVTTTTEPNMNNVTVTYAANTITYTVTPTDVSGQPLYGTTAVPETGKTNTSITVPNLPGYTPVTTTQVVPGTSQTLKIVYVPNTNYGTVGENNAPADGSIVSDPSHVYQKVTQPDGVNTEGQTVTITPVDLSGNPLYGQNPITIPGVAGYEIQVPDLAGYTSTTTTITPTNGVNQVVYVPNENYGTVGTNETPADGSIVNDPSHVYEKDVQPAGVNTEGQTVTITPVDLSGNPLYGQTPITIPGVAGYEVQVPDLAGYTPTTATITPTNGVNQVAYVPNENYGTVGTNETPADGSIVNDPSHVYEKDVQPAGVNTEGQTVTITPVDLSGNPLYGQAPITMPGVAGYEIQVPDLAGYTPTTTTITPTNGVNQVVYVPNANYGTVGENNAPADGSIVSDPSHVYEKDVQPAGVNTEGQTVTITPVDLNGDPLYGQAPITIPGVAGYKIQVPDLAGYTPTTTTITPTNGVNQVVYVPNENYGTVGTNETPADGSVVNDPSHVYEKDVQPAGTSIDMNAGHLLPSDTAEVSNTHVYEKDVQPDGVNTEGQTVTITPVDLSGNPLYGQAPITIPGVAGYKIQVPDLAGYTPTTTTITPTNGVNQVVYVPNPNYGTVGTNETPTDGSIVSDPSHVYEKDVQPAGVNTEGQTVTVTPVDLSGNPLYGQTPITIPGVAGYEIQVPDLAGYTPTMTTITPTNGVNQVVYVPNENYGTVGENNVPADGSILNDPDHVYQKVTQPDGVNTEGQTVTITPVDLSGNPLYGQTPITIPDVAGYEIQVPDLAGYTPTTTTITPTNGVNQVVYVPNENYGTVGTNETPADGSIVNDPDHVYQKVTQPEGVNTDGQTVTITPVDLSGNPLYGQAPITVPGVAGYEIQVPDLAGYTSTTTTITPTNGVNQVVYVPETNYGTVGTNEMPADGSVVSDPSHVYEKNVQPAGTSIDMNAGHALPDDMADVSNTHVYEKDVQPAGTSIDMNAGHVLPNDTAGVSNTHVYEKVNVSTPEVNWQNSTVIITPVDANGQPIKGIAPIQVTGVAGYHVQVPSLPGYTAQLTTIVATNGANQVVYIPNRVTGTVVLPSNLGGQVVTGVTGSVGDVIQVSVPQIAGYTADCATVSVRIEANGKLTPLAAVHYVAQQRTKISTTTATAVTQHATASATQATKHHKISASASAQQLPQTGSSTTEPTTLVGWAVLGLTAGLFGFFGKKRQKEDD